MKWAECMVLVMTVYYPYWGYRPEEGIPWSFYIGETERSIKMTRGFSSNSLLARWNPNMIARQLEPKNTSGTKREPFRSIIQRTHGFLFEETLISIKVVLPNKRKRWYSCLRVQETQGFVYISSNNLWRKFLGSRRQKRCFFFFCSSSSSMRMKTKIPQVVEKQF